MQPKIALGCCCPSQKLSQMGAGISQIWAPLLTQPRVAAGLRGMWLHQHGGASRKEQTEMSSSSESLCTYTGLEPKVSASCMLEIQGSIMVLSPRPSC